MTEDINKNRIGFIISDENTPNISHAKFVVDSNKDIEVGETVEIYTPSSVIRAIIEELWFYNPKYANIELLMLNIKSNKDATKLEMFTSNSFLFGKLLLEKVYKVSSGRTGIVNVKYPPLPGSIVMKNREHMSKNKG